QAQMAGPLPGPSASDPRALILTPRVGVQGAYTDNVRLTQDNRESDFVTRVYAGVDAMLNSPRAQGSLQVEASYDFYADSDDLNGWSARGFGYGSYALVQDLLAIEADGSITNGNVSTFGSSAVDRSGTDGRVQLSTLSAGPRLTTRLGDFADLDASARASYVAYEQADGSTVATLPEDSTFYNVDLGIDTGDRYSNVQLNFFTTYEEDDRDYRSYSAIASSFFRVAPTLRLIARVGYDNVQDTSLVDIDAAK